ncbi:MAG: hypothetical protein ACXVB1_13710 [Pseudobdellovibrionaceae bacterium]
MGLIKTLQAQKLFIHIWVALGLIFLGALVLGFPIFSFLFLFVRVILSFAKTVDTYIKTRFLYNRSILVAAIYGLSFVIDMGLTSTECLIAKGNAERVVQALKNYHHVHHRYPDSLSDLVPAQLPSIPIAAYRLEMNSFIYHHWQECKNSKGEMEPCKAAQNESTVSEHVSIGYVVNPPYGRRDYNFKENNWNNTID